MRHKQEGRASLAVLAVLLVVGAGAFFFFRPHTVRAADIRRDPDAFKGKVVTVVGTVTGGASVGGTLFGGTGGFFLLDDGSGQIGVATTEPAPSHGQRVSVTGEVAVAASLSVPQSWLKAVGFGGDGRLTAVVIKARSVSGR